MNRSENQFTRFLEKKGCEVVHISGDAGGHIPTDCEAVIITKCQTSHEKFWQVKDLYKDLDKPVFITDFGISPIRERLEQFLSKFPKVTAKYTPGDETIMSKALKEALPTYMKNNDRADKIITEDYLKGLSAKDTLGKLKDYRQANGSAYSINYIVAFREEIVRQYRPAPSTKPKVESKGPTQPSVAPSRERRVEPAKPVKAVEVTGLASAVEHVLNMSDITRDQKAHMLWQLINRQPLQAHVTIRKTKQGLQFFSTNPIDKVESPLVTLTQVQAIAIVQHLSEVEDYATDPNIS